MSDKENIVIVDSYKMSSEFIRILKKNGFDNERALQCSDIFLMNSLEGVLSHGVNRFPRFVNNICDGLVNPGATPTLLNKVGALEQWNGNTGPGPLNATFATERAMDIASDSGIGLVSLANTNHWMRGGTYGWQAAKKGYVFIGWTNTCANMPAWGATDPRLGNNPFVMAVPYGEHGIVLDFAMTQYSYGKLESYNHENRQLPYPGGFNSKGELTTDPGEILETLRALPVGYWKGAGFSMLLDILATILSGGRAVHDIPGCKVETAISQVFIAVNIKSLHNFPSIKNSIDMIIGDLKKSSKENDDVQIRYPGENTALIRERYLKEGIPVSKSLWDKILSL